MRIGVISDSHARRVVLHNAFLKLGKIDAVFHLGDLFTDAMYLQETFGVETHYVKGNCDYFQGAVTEKLVEFGNKRFYLTHGHLHKVKWGLNHLKNATINKNYDVVLFGHTHTPLIEFENNIMYMNPGSTADPRGTKKPTVGIIEIFADKIVPYIINID